MIVTVRVIPVILLALLFPVEMFCAIIIFITVMLCTPILFSSFILPLFTCSHKNSHYLCYAPLLCLYLLSVVWINLFYLQVLKVDSNSSSFAKVLLSLLSTAPLGALLTYATNRMLEKETLPHEETGSIRTCYEETGDINTRYGSTDVENIPLLLRYNTS